MEQKVSAMFAWHPDASICAKRIASRYQAAGMQVEFSAQTQFEAAQAEAKERGLTHLLYFHDAEHITMASFADEMGGFCVDILVSDLQLP